MSLVHPALLYGLGLAAVPVILHFLMRAKPKKLTFPALQLIQSRRKTNTRRLRLRHIWLLLLRMAVIVALVVAVSRPSLPAANYGLNLRESITLAGIAIAVIAAYQGLMHYWQRQRLASHELMLRRSMARGGAGLAAVLLLLLFVVWPWQQRVAAEISRPNPDVTGNLPVAAVFVFDSSGSMGYRFESSTRLDAATKIATEYLGELPAGSRVAVTDAATGRNVVFQADLIGARSRIESLRITQAVDTLDRRMMDAIRFQDDDRKRLLRDQGLSEESESGDQYVREVYVFTDMSATAWDAEASERVRQRMDAAEWLDVYLIDVGVQQPSNVAIRDLRLTSQSIPHGGEVTIDATVQITGQPSGSRAVELFLPDATGTLVKQGRRDIASTDEGAAKISFTVNGLLPALVQGELRLDSVDPLALDDVGHFSLQQHEPPSVLLVSDEVVETEYLHDALAPLEYERQQRAAWKCTPVKSEAFRSTDISPFDVVCLINVGRVSQKDWNRLNEFVRAGGGLAVFTGRGDERIDAVSWSSSAAMQVLPAELLGAVRFTGESAFCDVRDQSHPVFRSLTEYADGLAELSTVRFSRCWSVEPAEDAVVLADFRGNRRLPGLIERVVGEGRCVMLTSAVDNVIPGGNDWTSFANSWSFVVMMNQLMEHLIGRASDRFNYLSGQDVVVRLPAERRISSYVLRKPGFQNARLDVEPGQRVVTIRDADQVGHYQFVADDSEKSFQTGFSTRPRPEESDFERIESRELDAMFGKGRYQQARTMSDLSRLANVGRIGMEVFPIVIVVVAFLFCAEHFVANRFYEADQSE